MRIISIKDPRSPIAEAYRSIRTNIEYANLDKELKTIAVTSCQQNEGKSTTICNLAVNFTNLDNKKVLILEGDLRNPTVHRMFGVSNKYGITDVLTGRKTFEECVIKTEVEGLSILACGNIPHNPSEILGSRKMKNFIEEIKPIYDYIFIDVPPIGVVTDAGVVASYVDGTVLVIAANEVEVDMARIAKENLENVKANILGIVINKYEDESGSYGYYSYNYQREPENNTRRSRKKKRKRFIWK